MAGAWLATRKLAEEGLDTVKYQSCLTWGLIGSLIGARYMTTPAQVLAGSSIIDAFNPINGNFSIMGGFAGGVIAGAWRMRQLGMPVFPTLDMSTFGLALGTVVGRLGDLAIVEHLGSSTTVAWGYGIKPGYDVAPQHDLLECQIPGADGLCGVYHHVAAYDLLGAAVLLGVLFWIKSRFRFSPGQMLWIWVTWYGLQRFLLDFMRFGNGDATIGSLTWNQVSGLMAAISGVVLFWWFGRRTGLPQGSKASSVAEA
jgi:phosphatidylglycerol:prolipoprotein diacylglycerol transferase